MKTGLSFTAIALAANVVAHAAPFQNLGFDDAKTNSLSVDPGPVLRGTGPTEDLLPGWALTKGVSPQSTMGLNLDLLSFGYATLISQDQSDYFRYPVEGSYALHLVGTPGNQDPFSLSQRGDVPAGAQFLSYRYSGSPLLVSVNETSLQPAFQSTDSRVFDISPFSGQTVDLRLTTTGPLLPNEAGASYVDSLAFNVPEPATLTLTALGATALWLALGWSRRHSSFGSSIPARRG